MSWISNIRKSSCRSRDWKAKYEAVCMENRRLRMKLMMIEEYCKKARANESK